MSDLFEKVYFYCVSASFFILFCRRRSCFLLEIIALLLQEKPQNTNLVSQLAVSLVKNRIYILCCSIFAVLVMRYCNLCLSVNSVYLCTAHLIYCMNSCFSYIYDIELFCYILYFCPFINLFIFVKKIVDFCCHSVCQYCSKFG